MTPASIWRLPELRDLASRAGATRWALYQRSYGAASAKPTGVLSTLPFEGDFGIIGWPTFTPSGSYSGPLARMVAPAMKMGVKNTAPSAAYPFALCMRIAGAIAKHLQSIVKVAKIPPGRAAAFSALEADADLFCTRTCVRAVSSYSFVIAIGAIRAVSSCSFFIAIGTIFAVVWDGISAPWDFR